jgi:hypothetical protein
VWLLLFGGGGGGEARVVVSKPSKKWIEILQSVNAVIRVLKSKTVR